MNYPLPKVAAMPVVTLEADDNGFGTLELTAPYSCDIDAKWDAPQLTARQRIYIPSWAINNPKLVTSAATMAAYDINATTGATEGNVTYWPGSVKTQYVTAQWTARNTLPWPAAGADATNVQINYTWPNNYVTYDVGTTTYPYAWPMSKQEQWKARLASNLRPSIEAKNGQLMALNSNPAERRARQLLSDLVSREEFRRYLVRGFIMVKGRTGIL